MTKTFTGTGDFSTALDWSGGTIPGSGDDFEITASASATVSSLATAANGTIDASATLDIAAAGTLDLGGYSLSNAGILIVSGVVTNATLSGSGPFYQGGTLDNITTNAIDLSADSAAVNVTGTMMVGNSSITGQITLTGAGSRLTILDDQTFTYDNINIGSTTGGVAALIANQALTLNGISQINLFNNNSGAEIGGAGTVNAANILVAGTQDTLLIDVANFNLTGHLVNQGSGSAVTISSSNFTNSGTVAIGNVGATGQPDYSLVLAAAATNNGVINVDNGTVTLTTAGASVSGTGSLQFNSQGYAETNALVATATQTVYNVISVSGSQLYGGSGTGITTIDAATGIALTLAGDINGSGTLAIGDSGHNGTVVFGQADASYTGALTLAAGTLELGAGNQSSGGITFASGSNATLKIDGGAGPASETITGFTLGDTIDLTSIGLATAATLDSATHVLTITGGSNPISLHLAGDYSDFTFGVVSDGASGTDVVAVGPHVATVSVAADGHTNLPAGQAVTFTLAPNVALTTIDTTNGSPTLSLSNGKTATFDAVHSTSTSLVFNYTVAATGDNTPDLTITGLNTHGATLTTASGHEFTGFGIAALSGSDTHLVINIAPPVTITPPPVTSPTPPVTSPAPPVDTRFDLANLTASTSGSFFGGDYTGPVSYLQAQYLYAGSDNVVLGARVANVFLHSGAGNDALAAKTGSNVLDGGGGSNWLVGATGTDGGKDTFFADGRNDQHTWDTLVNFHAGDMLTLWGFNPASGSTSWSDNLGAATYQGATMHVGFGTSSGSDALVTFAGLSTQAAKFTTSTGAVGGVSYLAVTRVS